jgi:hypothetical protein
MTGYDTEDRYYATGYQQGGRLVYAIDLPLDVVAATLPKPDPNKPTPGNRRVKEAHARGFGNYVRTNEDWVAPALLLRAPDGVVSFKKTIGEVAGSQFGELSIPRLARTDLRILDGQHRILGICLAIDDIASEIERSRGNIAIAKRNGNAELEQHHRLELKKLEAQRERLHNECISVQIQIEDDPQAFMQMFVDIADNALGITGAIRSRFDSRKVVNRALDDVLKHALLRDRVDLEQDRIGGSSAYLMGAKHVADLIRTAVVGIAGRVSRRQEAELEDGAVVQTTNDFLDVLMYAFPQFEAVVEGNMSPEVLRKTSLLGSTSFLRALAGVYHELSKGMTDDEISDFFRQLSPHVSAPITEGSPWLNTGVFAVGASAPSARRQDLENLTASIIAWAKESPDWMDGAAA